MIDHLVYGAPELTSAVSCLENLLGVTAAAGGRHEGRGTHNALLALGEDTYLEVIAPDPSQPAPSGPRPFGLDHLAERRLVTFAVHVASRPADLAARGGTRRGTESGGAPGWQDARNEHIRVYVSDEQRSQPGCSAARMQPEFRHGLLDHQHASRRLERWRRRALDRGYDPGPVKTGGRRRLDGTELSWRLCQHTELPFGGAVPFLIDWGPTRSPALTAPTGCRLLELEVGHPQPAAVRAALRALDVAVPVRSSPAPRLRATLTTPRGRVLLA